MAKFSALLYREWRISRKQTVSQICASLLFGLIFLMLRWSMLYGNLQELNEELISMEDGDYSGTLKLSYYFSVFSFSLLTQLNIGRSAGSHKGDIQSGFLRYSYTMPITPAMRSAVKTAYMCIFRVVGYVLAVLYALFTSIWYDSVTINSTLLLALLIPAFIMVCYDTIESALVLRARTEKKASAMEASAGLGLMAVLLLLGIRLSGHIQARFAAAAEAEAQRMADYAAQYGEQQVAKMLMTGEITQDDPIKMILGLLKDMITEFIGNYIVWIVPATLILIVLGFWLRKKACEGRETP